MAIINPDFNIIHKLHQPANEGELALLHQLSNVLDDEYEIFFQPYVNGDNPDIVILRKNHGVLIIEVKDWDLNFFALDEKGNWSLRRNDTNLKSPFNQVENYKENFINLHIENFLEKTLKDSSFFGTIHCAVYFHKASNLEIKDLVLIPFKAPEQANYLKKMKYMSFLGKDYLNEVGINELLRNTRMNQPNPHFTEDLYLSFKRCLQPPIHMLEEGKNIVYTKEQQILCVSESGARRKIKGTAGGGKTLVLARRAVNAQKRCGKRVLILTFNLSLKNYIHDRISDIREEFEWRNFFITNYHQFFKTEANNHNLEIKGLHAWQDTEFFRNVKDKIIKFDAIFIDEVQDYKTEWLEILINFFLVENGEFVVFGDEKQNIYDRPLDENKEPTIPTILGRWNRSLKSTFRLSSEIARLATHFQRVFFDQKYTVDEIDALSTPEFGFGQSITYIWEPDNQSPEQVMLIIEQKIREKNLHHSDIAVLNSKVEYIREFEQVFRTSLRVKTKTTFETQEFYDFLKEGLKKTQKSKSDKERKIILNEKLELIRRNKKLHLYMKTGTAKISTIHSFKGWEIPSLFLIIENDADKEFNTHELIYTGLTRAKYDLFIINLGNEYYHNFFNQYID